ncbi:hypothetical protein FRB95_003657 [Tulasnella sp. JGI-2019a]|nr:hypothetical protein FRB95_003657 [Tulasnella sp. JGI-2019a]
MRSSFFSTFIALLFLASLSAAHIAGISAPAVVKAKKPFNLIFKTEGHIINYSDEFAIVGILQGGSASCNGCVGTPLAFFNLHQSHENTGHGNFTESVTIPTTGTYTLSIVVTSIFGINNGATLNPFTTNIKAT